MASKREDRDKLAGILADSLNKKFKDFKVAYFLDGADETPTDLTEWISTGSSMLDLSISNRKNGGIPVGRINNQTKQFSVNFFSWFWLLFKKF